MTPSADLGRRQSIWLGGGVDRAAFNRSVIYQPATHSYTVRQLKIAAGQFTKWVMVPACKEAGACAFVLPPAWIMCGWEKELAVLCRPKHSVSADGARARQEVVGGHSRVIHKGGGGTRVQGGQGVYVRPAGGVRRRGVRPNDV